MGALLREMCLGFLIPWFQDWEILNPGIPGFGAFRNWYARIPGWNIPESGIQELETLEVPVSWRQPRLSLKTQHAIPQELLHFTPVAAYSTFTLRHLSPSIVYLRERHLVNPRWVKHWNRTRRKWVLVRNFICKCLFVLGCVVVNTQLESGPLFRARPEPDYNSDPHLQYILTT